MTRRYESRYYSNESMRHIQKQINELWEMVDRRAEDVEAPLNVRAKNPTEGVAGVFTPQPFKVIPTGRGWYQVVDSDGKPIHEGKLRRDAARDACQVAMEGV